MSVEQQGGQLSGRARGSPGPSLSAAFPWKTQPLRSTSAELSYSLGVRSGRGSGTATVLFTDLVGSTDLMTQVGEPAFDELRRAHFAALRLAIERTGGEEIKNNGDGVMAVFGSAA